MPRTLLLRSMAGICCGLVALTAQGCAADTTVRVSGRVADDVITVQAPSISSPRPNPDAGFPVSASRNLGAIPAGRSTPTTVTAVTGLGSVSRIATVAVSLGQPVAQGDVIAEFDATALDAAVAAARADERVARAQVGVLGDAIDKADAGESTLAANRRTLKDAISQLTTTRARLAEKLVQLKALLAQLSAMTSVGPGGIGGGSLPASSTTGGASPLPPGTMSPAQLRAMIAQLEASIAKIDAGLAKANDGLRKLASARSTLEDARTQLQDLRAVARVGADAAAIGVRTAAYQRSLAIVRSPGDGAVVGLVSVGDVLAPGATVARVREVSVPRVQTWLAPQDLARVAKGDRAYIYGDWFASGAGLLSGRVTEIGQRADYPPTSFATKDVHLTRGLPVEITLDGYPGTAGQPTADTLPAGAPVDVTIRPNTARVP